jgi:hypothetical protein
MKKNHPGQWLNYPVESTRERLLLFQYEGERVGAQRQNRRDDESRT